MTRVKDKIKDKNAIAGLVDGEPRDLSNILDGSAKVEPLKFEDEEGKKIYWHSTAHIMAQAVKELWPDTKLGIGPPISEGFYYDFETSHRFTPEDLEKIEKRMKKIIKADEGFKRRELKKEEAVKLFKGLKEDYKVELIKELDGNISIYEVRSEKLKVKSENGEFVDLCRGPHIPSAGRIKAFKLLKIAGAYWKGDEHNPMLQRIYGISFPTDVELEDYLKKLEEARARDHRKLGKELELYSIFEEAGPGLVAWNPDGAITRDVIESFWKKEHIKRGYQLVNTPHIAKAGLWRTSGHYDYYEHLTTLKFDDEDYVLKPMNCIYHILLYKSRIRSYRELPVRYAELGTVYRCEKSGVLHGLTRVRGFTQDDAHIFCQEEQAFSEVMGVLELAQYMLESFGFRDYKINLSVREPGGGGKYAGSDKEWEHAEGVLEEVLSSKGLAYKRAEGEAVFYGPKIDIELFDALGRAWQGPTIQFDFNLPRRFNVEYIGKDNKSHPVIMVHRTVLGAMERFFGMLIEHYNGAFPVWLAPAQVVVASVTEKSTDYAREVASELEGYRVKSSLGDEQIGAKIRKESKSPYVLIVGEREKKAGTVSVRARGAGDIGSYSIKDFINLLDKKIEARI